MVNMCMSCDRGDDVLSLSVTFFFQAEDGIRDLVRSRGLGDVYKRQGYRHRLGRGHAALLGDQGSQSARGQWYGHRGHQFLSLIHI